MTLAMIKGLVDTNILIDLYRNNPNAQAWMQIQTDLAVSTIVWFEFVKDANGKAGQRRCLAILSSFELVYITQPDQDWAIQQVLRHQFSYGVAFADCLIAAVAYRLNVPLYTRNIKDFLVTLPANLVIKPC